MATNITLNGSVTLDESSGLQTGGVAAGSEDNNDSDVALSILQSQAAAFYNRLFTGLGLSTAFATANGVAKSADNFIAVSSTGSILSLGFVNGSGAGIPTYAGVATGGTATGLSAVDGGAISLFLDATLGNRMVLGVDASNNIVFALFLDPNAGLTQAKVWMVQFEAIAHGDANNADDAVNLFDSLGVGAGAAEAFDFSGLPSGQNLFGIVGTASSALVVIGKTPVLNADGTLTNTSNTINTSQGGGPTTIGINNQMFDVGDGAYFTFVNNPDPNFLATALSATEADDADNILFGSRIEVDGGFLSISQLQGSKTAQLKLTAFNGANNTQDGRDFATSGLGGTAVTILTVKVTHLDGTSSTTNVNALSATVTVIAGDKVEWTTSGVHDQVLVEGVAGKFDIGGFGVNQPSSTAVDIGSFVRFEDDGPDVDLTLNGAAELRLDETDGDADDDGPGGILATNSLAAAAYLTGNSAAFGSDGPAGANPTVWSLVLTGANAAGVDSGLDDAATNANVMLFAVDSTTIVGKVGGSAGAVVFTITINAANGTLTVVQNLAVEHNDPLDNDEAGLSSAVMNSGLVGARRTITDGDGDSDSDDADVSQVIKFEDDGPDVDLTLNGAAELRLDETDNDADDDGPGGILATNSLAAAAYLTGNSAAFGSDGPAGANPTVWSLVLTGANAAGVDSGLDDAATNANVMLFAVDSTTIVGKVGGSAGAVVFTITINAANGTLTVVQNLAVEHNDPLDNDEAGLSSAVMNSGLVGARRTITDGDGDSDSDDADVSQVIKFEDDGPDVDLTLNGAAELRLDETDNDADDDGPGGILATNSLAAAAYLTGNSAAFGSDGPAGANPTVWSLVLTGANAAGVDSGLDDAATNANVMLFAVDSTTIVGKVGGSAGAVVFTITINAANGTLTVVQNLAVEHNDPLDNDEAGLSSAVMNSGLVGARRTITDGDGDSDSDDADVGQVIKFEDDGPDVDLTLNGAAQIVVDESSLPATGSIETSDLFSANTADFGSDGEGADASSYKLLLSDDNSGLFDTETGDEVLLDISGDGTLITGSVNGGADVVFTIAIDEETGEVTLDQLRALKHGDASDPDEAATPLTLANELVKIQRTITDGDGDSDSDDVGIGQIFKFKDDGPVAPGPTQDDLNFLTDDTDITDSATLSTDQIFPTPPDFGADGPGTIDFELRLAEENGDSGLVDTETGEKILLVTVGDDIVGFVDEDGSGEIEAGEILESIRYSLTADDEDSETVTFTAIRAVVHDTAGDPDEENTPQEINGNLVFIDRTATDGDGDTADVESFDLGDAVAIKDDGPAIGPIDDGIVDSAAGSSVTKTLDGATGNDPNASPYIVTEFTESITVGGREIQGVLAGNSQSVTYYDDTNNDDIFGNAGDTAFYKLTLNEAGAGEYTFEVLVNPPPAFEDFDFGGLPSGQNLFGMVGDPDFALVVLGKVPVLKADGTLTNTSNTINTSQGGGPTTIGINNQMFDPGEGAYFTFVDNPDANFLATALSATEADDADNIMFGSRLEVDTAFLRISQLQGSKTAQLKLSCFDGNDTQDGRAFATTGGTGGLGTGTQVMITSVKVIHLDGTFSTTAVNALTATVTVVAGDRVEWTTSSPHDQVLVEGVAGKFDIGGFGAIQLNDQPDQLLEFTVQVTDGDGDTETSSFAVGIDGTGVFDDDEVGGVNALALLSLSSSSAGDAHLDMAGVSIA